MDKRLRICVLGHARHGKDTMAEILNEIFHFDFMSSSQAAADIFLYDLLKDKYNYQTPEECFEDRVNHRAEWYEAICDYNKGDRARLAKGILEMSDCYVGMRDSAEIKECKTQGLFDLIIWVDASGRLPLEDKSSFNIDKSDADIIIENNGTLAEFREKVIRLGKLIGLKVREVPYVYVSFPNENPIGVREDIVQNWIPINERKIGDTVFFENGGLTLSMKSEDFEKYFKKDLSN